MTRTRVYLLLAVFIVTVLFLNLLTSQNRIARSETTEININNVHDKQLKYILQWTSPNTIPFANWHQGQETFIDRNCKFQNCYVTSDRQLLKSVNDFDVVAFHGPEIVLSDIKDPVSRSVHQKYVFVSIESSHYYPVCKKRYDGFFNWTWTYKLNSDEPYGYITIRNNKGNIIGPATDMQWIDTKSMKPITEELKEKLKNKSKAAAWLVSNCNALSGRQVFVKKLRAELQKLDLDVDVYGGCGDLKCPVEEMDECLKKVETDYFFYMALENSFSEDYVTEKLLTALQHYAVPVVFGSANYTRFMSDGMYLNGGEMEPQELAKEMSDIMKSKDRYYEFFKWHNHYSYHAREDSPDSDDLCKMCAMLNDEANMTKTTVYNNFTQWWNVPNACVNNALKIKPDFRMFLFVYVFTFLIIGLVR